MEKELQDLFDSHGGILKTGELLQKGIIIENYKN